MSYNSKIYIVEKMRSCDYGCVLAEMDLNQIDAVCKHTHQPCGSFVDLFKYKVNFDSSMPKKDAYGCPLCYAYLEDVFKFVKNEIKHQKKLYNGRVCRRLIPLKSLLKGYNNGQFITDLMDKSNRYWKEKDYIDILVVHYGY